MKRTLIAFGLAAALTIAGCSSDGAQSATVKKVPAKQTTSTTTAQFVANTKDTPGTLKNFVGARQDVHDTKCVRIAKGWRATGKVTNRSNRAVTYRIYVSFVYAEATAGIAQTDIAKVAPRATGAWAAMVKAPGEGLQCVLRVERADL